MPNTSTTPNKRMTNHKKNNIDDVILNTELIAKNRIIGVNTLAVPSCNIIIWTLN